MESNAGAKRIMLAIILLSMGCNAAGTAAPVSAAAEPMAAATAISAELAQPPPERIQEWEYDVATQQWVAVTPPAPGTPEGDLHAANVLIRNGKFTAAIRALKRWEKAYGPTDPLFPSALVALAQAQIGARDHYEAYKTTQRFMNEFEGLEQTRAVLRQSFVIAEAFLSGVKRKFLGLRILPADDVALRILDDISAQYAGDEIAEFAIRTKGDYFFRTGDHDLAELEYSRLINEYAGGRYHTFALKRAADSAMAQFAGTAYDESPLIEASGRYTEYMAAAPDDAGQEGVGEILEAIRQERAMKDFSIGRYYEKTRHVSSAVFYYENILRDWPDTIGADRAAARLEVLRAAFPASPPRGPDVPPKVDGPQETPPEEDPRRIEIGEDGP